MPLFTGVDPDKPIVLKMKTPRDRDPFEPAPPPDPPLYPVVATLTPPHIVVHLTGVNEVDAHLAAHPEIVDRLGALLVGALPRSRMFGGRPVVQVRTRPMAGTNGPARLMIGIWLWSPVPPPVFVDDTDRERWIAIAQQLAASQERGLLSACGIGIGGAAPTSEAVPSAGSTACLFAAMPMIQRFLVEALASANLSLPDIRLANPRVAPRGPAGLRTSIDGVHGYTGVAFTLDLDEDLRVTGAGGIATTTLGASANVDAQWVAWLFVPIANIVMGIGSAIVAAVLGGEAQTVPARLPMTPADAIATALFRREIALRTPFADLLLAFEYDAVATSPVGIRADAAWSLRARTPAVDILGPARLAARAGQLAEGMYTLRLTDFLPAPNGGYTVTFGGDAVSADLVDPTTANIQLRAPSAGMAVRRLAVTVTGAGADTASTVLEVEVHVIGKGQVNPTDPKETRCRLRPWLCG